jgi:hypothetical protein
MKNILNTLTILLLSISYCATIFANDFNVSTLHLKLESNNLLKISLNEQVYDTAKKMHTIEGLQPGKYLLKVTELEAEVLLAKTSGSEVKQKYTERLVYYGYINIAPKRVIFAYINNQRKFKIHKERKTNTVYAPLPFQEFNEQYFPLLYATNVWYVKNYVVKNA